MSDSVWPHRRQPTRLPRPWDFLGKNTEVGSHFLLQCMKVKSESEVVSDSSRPHGLQATRLLHPWDLPGKSTGVGCHCLLQTWDAWFPLINSNLLKFWLSGLCSQNFYINLTPHLLLGLRATEESCLSGLKSSEYLPNKTQLSTFSRGTFFQLTLYR